MRKPRKELTTGQMIARDVMGYLNLMYPDIMQQSRSFRTSLKNYMAMQIDMQMNGRQQVTQARSPIEMMVDQACGYLAPTKGARHE